MNHITKEIFENHLFDTKNSVYETNSYGVENGQHFHITKIFVNNIFTAKRIINNTRVSYYGR